MNHITHLDQLGPTTCQLGNSVARAMNNAPDYQFVLAKKADRVAPLSWFFGQFASRLALAYGRIVSTASGDAGIYTFAPNRAPSLPAVLRAGILQMPQHFGWLGAWRALRLGLHLERRRLLLTNTPHWYVIAVGVAPDQQGQGKGKALLAHVLQQADQDQVPTYLEVFEERLISLYQPMGFTVLHRDKLPGDLTLWCLMRLPACQSSGY